MRQYAPAILAAQHGFQIDQVLRKLEEDEAFPEIVIVSIEDNTNENARRQLERGFIDLGGLFGGYPHCHVPRYPQLSCELDNGDDCQTVCDTTRNGCGPSPTCFDVDDFCRELLSVEVTQQVWTGSGRERVLERTDILRVQGEECRGEGQEGQCCLDIYDLAIKPYEVWVTYWFWWWGWRSVEVKETRWRTFLEDFAEDVMLRFPSLLDEMFSPGSSIEIVDGDGTALMVQDIDSATDLFQLICPVIGGTFCCESNCESGGGMDPHFKVRTQIVSNIVNLDVAHT